RLTRGLPPLLPGPPCGIPRFTQRLADGLRDRVRSGVRSRGGRATGWDVGNTRFAGGLGAPRGGGFLSCRRFPRWCGLLKRAGLLRGRRGRKVRRWGLASRRRVVGGRRSARGPRGLQAGLGRFDLFLDGDQSLALLGRDAALVYHLPHPVDIAHSIEPLSLMVAW